MCAVKLTSSTWTRWIDLVFSFFRYTFQASKMLTCVSWLSHRNEKKLGYFYDELWKEHSLFFGTCPHTQRAQQQLSACEEIEWIERKNCDSFYGQLSVRHSHRINQVCLSEPASVCRVWHWLRATEEKKWINSIRHASWNKRRQLSAHRPMTRPNNNCEISWTIVVEIWVYVVSHKSEHWPRDAGQRKVLANN